VYRREELVFLDCAMTLIATTAIPKPGRVQPMATTAAGDGNCGRATFCLSPLRDGADICDRHSQHNIHEFGTASCVIGLVGVPVVKPMSLVTFVFLSNGVPRECGSGDDVSIPAQSALRSGAAKSARCDADVGAYIAAIP